MRKRAFSTLALLALTAVLAAAAWGAQPNTVFSPVVVPEATPEGEAAPSPDAAHLLREGLEAQHAGDVETAVDRFRRAAQAAPEGPEAIEATYQLGVLAYEAGDYGEAVARFTIVRDRYPAHERAGLAGFWLAESLLEAGRPGEALPLYDAFAQTHSAVEDYVRLRRARVSLSAGNAAAALEELARVEAAPTSPHVQDQARRLHAVLLVQAGDYAGAADRYRALVADPNAPDRLALLAELAEALRMAGRAAERRAVLAETARVYPASAQGWHALEALGDEAPQVLTPYQIGRVYYFHRVNDRALAAFQRHRAELPGSAEEPWARYRAALVLQRLGRNDEALQELRDLVAAFPASEAAQDALWEYARFLSELGRFDESKQAYQEFRTRYPASQRVQDAVFEEALTFYRAGDHAAAASALGSVPAPPHGGAGSARNALWRGKALLATGDRMGAEAAWREAARLAPGSYYGLRAELLLHGAPGEAAPAKPLRDTGLTAEHMAEAEAWLAARLSAAAPASDARQRVLADPLVHRAALLEAMGQHASATAEYQTAVRSHRGDGAALYALAVLLHERGQFGAAMLAVALLQDVTRTGNPRDLPRLLQVVLHPTPYRALVHAAAAEHGLDPALLYALMKQESLFDPRATSSAQARGLTQVIPSTGREIAAGLGLPDFQQAHLYRPVVSIRFGAFYLARQLAFLGGNPVFALAAYNGGPGSALRWMANNRAIDPDLFVETIDFPETRLYVHNVMENYARYRLLYGG